MILHVDSTKHIMIGLDLLDEAPHHDVTSETTARICDKSVKANKFRLKTKC